MQSSPSKQRAVRKRLADGSTRTYYYDRVRSTHPEAAGRYPDGSIGALIVAYQISPEFRALRPKTKSKYGRALKVLALAQHDALQSLKRRDIISARDAINVKHGPATANAFIMVTRTLLAWGVDRGWLEYSPAMKIKPLAGGHLPAWSEEHAVIALAGLPEHLRRVVILGLYTGQRRGDLVAMPWSAYQDGVIRVVQDKTGASLRIPAHPVLRAAIAEWAKGRTAVTILTTKMGNPFKADYLSREMREELMKLGLPDGLCVHGLRKLAAANLANAGCSTHEIASVTGHKSLAMIELYTASASQERMAQAAISRLETGFTAVSGCLKGNRY